LGERESTRELRQDVPVERISFIDALRWLQSASPGAAWPRLVITPFRPNRFEPRIVKRRPKQYSLMTKPRSLLKQKLGG
jgi:hypothetical protein